MSRSGVLRIAAAIPASGFVWASAASSLDGGIWSVVRYVPAGVLSGVALAWIARTFARVVFTRGTAALSGGIGLLILTPLIALLIDGKNDPSSSSVVVLAIAAAGAAAMGGAVWGVMTSVGDAFTEWRNGRVHSLAPLQRGAHR